MSKPAGQSQHLSSSWQNLTASVDYLSQLSASSLPISLHDFLKYSAENLKKDNNTEVGEHNLTSSSNYLLICNLLILFSFFPQL